MQHLPHLIQDLGLILVAAAIVTILFKKFKQPVVLGYLVAGFLVSPYFPYFLSIQDHESIKIWAEIGVIFMLFGLGLEFSFKKLASVGKSATLGALSEVIFMIGVGYLVGQLIGWNTMDSLFIGAILSVSSTTIIVKAFDELGLKGKGFVSIVFGILIVEDLISILLLVLLSSIAITQTLSGAELVNSSLKFGFFLILWFLLGIYLLPTFLNRVKIYLSDETILVVSVGLCLLMVIIATQVGFSPALGAFIMGSLLAETKEGHRIEQIILPVKDLFSAVFFVSVGMLINPSVLVEYFPIIILITLVTIVGKLVSSGFGVLISGKSFKTSIQSGMSLAQIGEFSFLIATLGVSLNVISDFIYPITIAVSAVTTFTTPYTIKFSEPLSNWMERRLPNIIKTSLVKYESAMATTTEPGFLNVILKSYGIKILSNSVIIVALTVFFSSIVLPYLNSLLNIPSLNLWVGFFTLLACAPFGWAIIFGQVHIPKSDTRTINKLQKLQIGIILIRILIGCTLMGFVLGAFTNFAALSGSLLIGLSALGFFFSRFAEPLYQKIEHRFMANFTAKERHELEKNPPLPELAPWNIALTEFTLSPSSPLVAKTLQNSKLKETYGVTVTMIIRGAQKLIAPPGTELLLPYDKLCLIGTEDQLQQAREAIEVKIADNDASSIDHYGLTSLTLTENDSLVNKTIRNSGLREMANGLIVGIERDGMRILSPEPNMELKADDLVWIVGDLSKIKKFR